MTPVDFESDPCLAETRGAGGRNPPEVGEQSGPSSPIDVGLITQLSAKAALAWTVLFRGCLCKKGHVNN